jgi:DNA-binding MurR/RpiR family transcriptional regulator
LAMLPGETVRQMAARTGMSKSAIGRLSQVSG